jgi:hypothetical protein
MRIEILQRIGPVVAALSKAVILSGVPRGKAGRNGVEGSLSISAFSAFVSEKVRDPSTALRPPFHLRSAQDDSD